MKKLYFIRHGESEGNAREIFTGRLDLPLTNFGRKQAELAGDAAKKLKIDLIVSSPLKRATQTAEIVAESIGYPKDRIFYSDLLMERNYGELQGKPYSAVEGLEFDDIPGIETTAQINKRAIGAVEFIESLEPENILISSHGTIGRTIRHQLFSSGEESIEVPIEEEIPNAQIVEWI